MPIKSGGTQAAAIKFNGTNLVKVTYNGVTVFESSLRVFYNGVYNGCTALSAYNGFPSGAGGTHRPILSNTTYTLSGTTSRTLSVGYGRGSLLTNQPIDLTSWKYITIKGTAFSHNSTAGACIMKNTTGATVGGYTNIVTDCKTFNANAKTDISSVTGAYYLGMWVAEGQSDVGNGYVTITEILLEN